MASIRTEEFDRDTGAEPEKAFSDAEYAVRLECRRRPGRLLNTERPEGDDKRGAPNGTHRI